MPELATAHGRDQELRLLRGLVDRVGECAGGAVLCGEPGIGKSFLLDMAGAHAAKAGVGVLSTVGVRSETGLSFAGLYQLLRPLLDGPQVLPEPLPAAFGMTDGGGPDSGAVAPAVLDLLAGAASHAPLLLLVDNVQWLDLPTCEVLAFVASRRGTARIALVAAARRSRQSAAARGPGRHAAGRPGRRLLAGTARRAPPGAVVLHAPAGRRGIRRQPARAARTPHRPGSRRTRPRAAVRGAAGHCPAAAGVRPRAGRPARRHPGRPAGRGRRRQRRPRGDPRSGVGGARRGAAGRGPGAGRERPGADGRGNPTGGGVPSPAAALRRPVGRPSHRGPA
ncbi:ATP-binding protein, partial [Streptacidiphilus sp. 4-A2]|nr:ATP-binding protein [Streptacidiphilus sp. 4-A2]